jgi:cytidylate kinase
VGRAANFILGPKRGFHIRVVCPTERRIFNLIEFKNVDRQEALKQIEDSDHKRRDFARRQFNADVDDPVNYDLVLNAAYIDVEEMVSTAIEAIRGKSDKLIHWDDDSRGDDR